MITIVISLDTELAWGRLSSDKEEPLFEDDSAGRSAIRYVLNILDEYSIPATWGIVGHLLLEKCNENSHYNAPYVNEIDPKTNRESDPLFYAPEILNWIRDADVNHEVAGHSFSHPRFSDLNRLQMREELGAMMDAFDDRGETINSLIHPGIDLAHLDLLPEFGIERYSGPSRTRNYTLKEGLPRLLHRDPALLSVPRVKPKVDEYDMCMIPRSRSLRDERWGWLNPHRLRSALKSNGDGVIHLSFHPHNVIYDRFLRRNLPKVAKVIADARSKGTIKVQTFNNLL